MGFYTRPAQAQVLMLCCNGLKEKRCCCGVLGVESRDLGLMLEIDRQIPHPTQSSDLWPS